MKHPQLGHGSWDARNVKSQLQWKPWLPPVLLIGLFFLGSDTLHAAHVFEVQLITDKERYTSEDTIQATMVLRNASDRPLTLPLTAATLEPPYRAGADGTFVVVLQVGYWMDTAWVDAGKPTRVLAPGQGIRLSQELNAADLIQLLQLNEEHAAKCGIIARVFVDPHFSHDIPDTPGALDSDLHLITIRHERMKDSH